MLDLSPADDLASLEQPASDLSSRREIDERVLDLYGISDVEDRGTILRFGATNATGWELVGMVDEE